MDSSGEFSIKASFPARTKGNLVLIFVELVWEQKQNITTYFCANCTYKKAFMKPGPTSQAAPPPGSRPSEPLPLLGPEEAFWHIFIIRPPLWLHAGQLPVRPPAGHPEVPILLQDGPCRLPHSYHLTCHMESFR